MPRYTWLPAVPEDLAGHPPCLPENLAALEITGAPGAAGRPQKTKHTRRPRAPQCQTCPVGAPNRATYGIPATWDPKTRKHALTACERCAEVQRSNGHTLVKQVQYACVDCHKVESTFGLEKDREAKRIPSR